MHGTKVKKKKVVPFTYTHVCILCWRRIRLGWDKSREGWVTTEGQAHINEYHKSEKQKDKLVKEKLEKTEKKQSFLMKGMAAAGDPRSGASSAFGLSPGQYAKTKAARYYIYGQARVSKMTFDDEEFRELLISYYVAGGGNREKCPFLRRRELVDYVRGEFKCFCLLMAEFAKRQVCAAPARWSVIVPVSFLRACARVSKSVKWTLIRGSPIPSPRRTTTGRPSAQPTRERARVRGAVTRPRWCCHRACVLLTRCASCCATPCVLSVFLCVCPRWEAHARRQQLHVPLHCRLEQWSVLRRGELPGSHRCDCRVLGRPPAAHVRCWCYHLQWGERSNCSGLSFRFIVYGVV